MTNRELAAILEEMGTILEIKGENPFKCRAFLNASRIIGAATEEIGPMAAGGTLTGIRGIGKGLAAVIADLVLTGKSAEYESLRSSVPPGLLTLLGIQGLGPKKVRLLHEKLGIDSPEKLREAAESGSLAGLVGFGEKSRENILRGLDLLSRSEGLHLFPFAEGVAATFIGSLSAVPSVAEISTAGSLRRKKEVVGDVDILVAASQGGSASVIREFTSHAGVDTVLSSGRTKASVMTASGVQCDLRVVTPAQYPFALCYFTGSKDHNVALRGIAGRSGLSLNEYGFTLEDSGRGRAGRTRIPRCRDETDIYRALGLSFIPPELREDAGEIEAAKSGSIPDLIAIGDLQGTFHCHTTYSDGRNTLKDMADGALALKWKYIGIADHSRAAAYAGGLSPADVRRQRAEIDALNANYTDFRIFAGTEVDILPDGTLDWSDAILSGFDYVVASVHSGFNMTESAATRRIIRALRNRHVTMLGHPTGRLLLQREGYPLNVREVIDAASDHGIMIEINANPNRLDLDSTYCRYAREKGVLICINPDAHDVRGLRDVEYGVNVARKGWLTKGDVFNTRPPGEVIARLGI